MVSYGAEGLTHADNRLFVVSNTFVNDRARDGTFVFVRTGGTAVLTNNVFAGPGSLLIGPGSLTSNLALDPGFVDRSTYDYHLAKGSGAIDAATGAGRVGSFSLTPEFEYRHVAGQDRAPASSHTRHRCVRVRRVRNSCSERRARSGVSCNCFFALLCSRETRSRTRPSQRNVRC